MKSAIFRAHDIRAFLDGRKTMHRWVIKPQPPDDWLPEVGRYSHSFVDRDGELYPGPEIFGAYDEGFGVKLPYAPGDEIWVKESHRLVDCECTETCRRPGMVWYEADESGCENASLNRLRPSIHMPQWASRITLEVTGVRVERLQDISAEDVKSEGHRWEPRGAGHVTARENLRECWTPTHGPGSWDANPWVIVAGLRRRKDRNEPTN